MRHALLLLFWLVSDIAVFIVMYALSYFLRVGWIFSTDFAFEPYMRVVCAIAPLWLLVLICTRTFALTRNQNTLRNGAYICYAAVVGVALFALGYYFTYGLFFSRKLLVYALILTAVGVWVWHILFDFAMRRLLRRNPSVFRALIVGVTRESSALIAELNRRKNPITPVAILDGRGTKETEIDGVPVLGKLNKLDDVLREKGITHLIQCSDLEQSLNLLSACREKKIVYMLLPSVLGIIEHDEKVESLEGQPVTMVSPPSQKWKWFFR